MERETGEEVFARARNTRLSSGERKRDVSVDAGAIADGEGMVWKADRRELQFHRIPEDEGTAGLEAFHGKPNIRGMHRRYTPEFLA